MITLEQVEQIKNDVAGPVLALDHPRFKQVWESIFTRRLVADCMTHACTMVDKTPHQQKNDACCQYGVDVDLTEREAILAKADLIRPLLRAEVQHLPWFEDEIEEDPDYPSGKVVRSAVFNDRCLFLAHDQRGCAIHRASFEQGWDFNGVKPGICRLFPLSYEDDTIVIADEYPEYSCAHTGEMSVYRGARDGLRDLFGLELIAALDAVEARVMASQPRKLPVVS
jgi:Fe-S-cluster containining protein